jgi:hypothetical protein
MNNENPIPLELEPIRINRFRVVFPEQFNFLSSMVRYCDRPIYHNNEWNSMVIIFRDVIAPSTKQNLYDLKEYLQDNICTIQIEDFDPVGFVVSRWNISFNLYHTNFNFGFNDYGNDGIQEISLSFRPLTCVLEF